MGRCSEAGIDLLCIAARLSKISTYLKFKILIAEFFYKLSVACNFDYFLLF